MAASNYILFLGVSSLFMLIGCHTSQQHGAIFIFGDSIFASGNNNFINTTTIYQANFWPYGESYFYPPTGRFSNGRIITDFIANYAGLPFIPIYLDPRNKGFGFGANFASAGAGVLVETLSGLVIDLKTQLQHFRDLVKHYRESLGNEETEKLLSNAIYMFSCGGNDYAINNFVSPIGGNGTILYPYTYEQYVGMVIGNLTEVLVGIYEEGGRKIGIMDLPQLACYAGIRMAQPGYTCNKELEKVTNLHNQKLSDKLQDLENLLEGFMYAKLNYYAEMKKRMTNPSKYGFKVANAACCGSGPFCGLETCGGTRGTKEYYLCDNVDEYLFFDPSHPTEVACRQFADMFWSGHSNVTAPYNLKALFEIREKESSATCIEVV